MPVINDQELNELLQYFGLNPFTDQAKGPDLFNYDSSFQLPVQVGMQGVPLDEGGKPWIVSRHAPGKQFATPTHPQGHKGLDLKAPKGTPVYPIADGIVSKTGTDPKGGNVVFTSHMDGKITVYYAHLDSILVQPGQQVSKRTPIGTVGDSGNAKGRGAHLHYEVRVDGQNTDPLSLNNKKFARAARKAKLLDFIRQQRLYRVENFVK